MDDRGLRLAFPSRQRRPHLPVPSRGGRTDQDRPDVRRGRLLPLPARRRREPHRRQRRQWGAPRCPCRARPRARCLHGRGHHRRRARPGPGRLHAHRESSRWLRFPPSRHAGTGRRPDRIGNLVARHVRLALRVEPSRPRLLLQSDRIRSRAHRPRVREQRPCPVTGVIGARSRRSQRRRRRAPQFSHRAVSAGWPLLHRGNDLLRARLPAAAG